MLPTSHSQSFYDYPATSSGSLYPSSSHGSMSYSTSAGMSLAGPQPTQDPNAPEMFNHNIKMALQCVEVISRLAKSASNGIDHAFHPAPEASPMSASGDMVSLRHYLDMLSALLVNSGVGALPMVSFPADGSAPVLPSVASLMEETTTSVNEMYTRQKQIQENNAVVASLLFAPETSRR